MIPETHYELIVRSNTNAQESLSLLTNTHCFKDGVVAAIISPGHEARPSHQACTHVAYDIPVQIGHHHHIKLLGLGHQLKTHTNTMITCGSFS